MLRDPGSAYKFGRATPREGSLWKVKRFSDGDAVVVGLEEGVMNQNEAGTDEFGRIKRSTAAAGKKPANRIGTILGKDADTGELVRISPGCLTARQRVDLWAEPGRIVGRLVTYKWFDYGIKDAPRFCTFKAFRDAADRSARL